MLIINKLRNIFLKLYFYFNDKILFKDKFGLSYYLYKNSRPNNSFSIGVRTDDTTVLHTIDKILSSSNLTNNNFIHCIDVGGYIGVITLMMSKSLQKVKKKFKIHTFEPFKESFLRLKENVDLNHLSSNAIINNLAVSDKSGTSALWAYSDTPSDNHLDFNSSQNNKDGFSKKSVKVISLRDYIYENNINQITICKVDAEGADYLVVKGICEYLNSRLVDFFILEYQDTTYEKIKHILSASGYTVYYMVRNENILVNSFENYPKNCKSLLNFIAVSPEKKIDFIKKFKIK